MVTRKRCVLCGPIVGTTVMQFPSKPDILDKWLKYCCMEREHLRKSHRLCAHHFNIDDFIGNKNTGRNLRLKIGAIPGAKKSTFHVPIVNETKEAEPSSQSSQEDVVAEQHPCTCKIEFLDCQSEIQVLPEVKIECPESSEESVKVKVEVPDVCDPLQTPVKGRLITPRYFGDIASTDDATPIMSKRYFFLAKKTIMKQAKKIKTLQQKNRRLLKKMNKLENMVNRLRRQNTLTKKAVDNIIEEDSCKSRHLHRS